jgi:putative tRNA adenosine deaminase-associated protein
MYSLAEVIAEELAEIGEDELTDDDNILGDAPPAHDSAPFGDADIVEDLGTSAADLLAMCAHEGTLPMDVLVAVCEKAGCGTPFDDLRA